MVLALLPRRKFLIGAAAGICAPAIVRAQMMPLTGAGGLFKARAVAPTGFTLKAHAVAGATSDPTTSAIDTTGANLLVVVVSQFSGSPIGTLSDSKSNTWTPLAAQSDVSAYTRIFYCASPVVGAGHTFTFNGSGIFGSIAVQAWSGANVSPFDVENGANIQATSLATGSVTPSQSNSLIIAALSVVDAGTYAIDNSFTISDQSPYTAGVGLGIGAAYLVQGAASSINPTWSWGSTASAAAAIAVFKP